MKRGMLRSITDRYGDIEQQPLYICPCSRFKVKVFSSATCSAGGNEPQLKHAKTDAQSTDKQSSTLWSLFDETVKIVLSVKDRTEMQLKSW